jgi:hypothetical protein
MMGEEEKKPLGLRRNPQCSTGMMGQSGVGGWVGEVGGRGVKGWWGGVGGEVRGYRGWGGGEGNGNEGKSGEIR